MVSEPVSKKFGTEKSLGTGLEKIWYRKKSRNRSRKNLVPKKSHNGYQKKVQETVPTFFFLQNIGVGLGLGTEKSLGTGLEKNWYQKKSRNRSRKN